MSCVVLNGQYSFCDFMLKVLSGYFFKALQLSFLELKFQILPKHWVFSLEGNSFCEFQKYFLPKCLS